MSVLTGFDGIIIIIIIIITAFFSWRELQNFFSTSTIQAPYLGVLFSKKVDESESSMGSRFQPLTAFEEAVAFWFLQKYYK